jgi:hypothetical protein
MARASKRHREERRFGKPERLADLVLNTPVEQWLIGNLEPDDARRRIRTIQEEVAQAMRIEAGNVAEYFAMHDRDYWTYKTDFPCSSPPFPKLFIESHFPAKVNIGGEIVAAVFKGGQAFGFLFVAVDSAGELIPIFERPGPGQPYTLEEMPEARWFCRAMPILRINDKPVYMSCLEFFAVSERGEILTDPSFVQSGLDLSAEQLKQLHNEILQWFMPCLLTISFMNCKNCALSAVERDQDLNRKRRKHGLKPFLRYHTINIEPMRKVLKTEGNIESTGLKRALHICRGHFSRYSEERPLFGKVAGTFWIPAHLRGTTEEGIVVSDYQVGAPKPESTA